MHHVDSQLRQGDIEVDNDVKNSPRDGVKQAEGSGKKPGGVGYDTNMGLSGGGAAAKSEKLSQS